jgi:hypothetical protein
VVEDAAGVGERFEAPSSVVLAHAGVADAAEGQLGDERVEGAVFDDGVARFGAVEDLVDHIIVLGEDVETERVGVAMKELWKGWPSTRRAP